VIPHLSIFAALPPDVRKVSDYRVANSLLFSLFAALPPDVRSIRNFICIEHPYRGFAA
jgi:hypothetical protein